MDDRFELGRIIARGGFATVFEGRDRRQGLPCAVKIFRHELLANSWMEWRFQQEVSALQQIDHVNVVRIYGHRNTGTGVPYLRQTGSALAEIHAGPGPDSAWAFAGGGNLAIHGTRAGDWLCGRVKRHLQPGEDFAGDAERLSVLLPDSSMDLPVRIREFLRGSGIGLSAGSVELVAGAPEVDPARRPKDAQGFAKAISVDLQSPQQY